MFGLLCPARANQYRPTASAGVITNAALAYDVDAAPWATKADRALVTGSAVSGTPDYVQVTYNGFSAISKVAFSTCNLQVVLDWTGGSVTSATGAPASPYYLPSSLGVVVEYRVNGGTYINLGSFQATTNLVAPPAGDPAEVYSGTKVTLGVAIPSSSFTASLANLDVRFTLGTFTYVNGTYSFVTNGSYSVWDIQANLV